jgi:hypothetical protein
LGPQKYHLARRLDCSGFLSGFFFRVQKAWVGVRCRVEAIAYEIREMGTFWLASNAPTMNSMTRRPLLDSSPETLKAWMTERGHRSFHAHQVVRWVFDRRAEAFEGMSDLPRTLRGQLDEEWAVFGTTIHHHHVAADGTAKLLLEAGDGRRVECVLMAEDDRRTVCVSTQVGCAMECVFCASARIKKSSQNHRNDGSAKRNQPTASLFHLVGCASLTHPTKSQGATSRHA